VKNALETGVSRHIEREIKPPAGALDKQRRRISGLLLRGECPQVVNRKDILQIEFVDEVARLKPGNNWLRGASRSP